ncbi:endonuclease domain-containing protein [Desulforamulus ferrireducens]|uniref:DUF559 domain-containing protein n=1 Tax=Desulforamulus ferrireducens TaxID=1833852 RepID=A0A1S6IZW2_9FIRM|nr:endonuclease domain-containing protein [Desulforamulus ferrireducens]AQS60300.1 hypothetical protein B0537_15225 [Desulforamulus ferrireducens]
MSLPYNGNLIPQAKTLRKNMTPQEKKLWYQFLSKYSPRCQRQKAIADYIVDFYCHQARLVIELDGSQHYSGEGLEYDARRTEVLKKLGVEVVRFSNLDVDRNFRGVCEEIDRIIKSRRGVRKSPHGRRTSEKITPPVATRQPPR